jgi:bifunctional DNA-binding transcriptional regulator/antitoxin component of YhaV-PrlF toxin-antitoxin module
MAAIRCNARTTVPKAVRDRLRLDSGPVVCWVVRESEVVLQPGEVNEDPAIGAFLEPLARDVAAGKVSIMPQGLVDGVQTLVKGVRIDPNASFDDAVSL